MSPLTSIHDLHRRVGNVICEFDRLQNFAYGVSAIALRKFDRGSKVLVALRDELNETEARELIAK
jgi:hypothetical protein